MLIITILFAVLYVKDTQLLDTYLVQNSKCKTRLVPVNLFLSFWFNFFFAFCDFAIVSILYYLETNIEAKGSILTESTFFLINDIFFATQRVVKIRNANNRVTEYVRTVLKFFEVKHKSKDRLQMGFRIHADLNTNERRRWQE